MGLHTLYRGTAEEVLDAIDRQQLIPQMAENFYELNGESPRPAEIRSWQNSIPHLARLLVNAELGDTQMLLEVKLPVTSIRMDIVLVGSDPQTGKMSVVIVENKQWSKVELEPGSELVRVDYQHTARTHIHPVNQAWGYRQVMDGFVPLLRDVKVRCIANMHNASQEELRKISIAHRRGVQPEPMYTRMYGKDQRDLFMSELRAVLSTEKSALHARELLSATVRSTEPLMTTVARGLDQRTVFPLLDEQREAYDYVRAQVERARTEQHKEVIVIQGGPGTGKSVIALELMRAFNAQGVDAIHATGSKSFTRTLRKHITEGWGISSHQFSYFNNFSEAAGNHINVIIADEAHRLRSRSAKNSKKAQVVELIEATRVPVFLLDEHQNVRPHEVGSVERIRDAVASLGLKFHKIDLRHQFRCGGSQEYIDWVDGLLGLIPGEGPRSWKPQKNFELRVAPTPEAMERFLRRRTEDGHGARIAAGFCWPWSPTTRGGLVNDVVIGDWRRPWNSRSDHYLGKIPPSYLWATDPGGFEQIGCVYTAQGFEYDYAGVIFGNDLLWRGRGWTSDASANKDYQVNSERDFDHLARKIYRVLATRGMKGAVLYSTDPETKFFFARLGVPLIDADGNRI